LSVIDIEADPTINPLPHAGQLHRPESVRAEIRKAPARL